MTWRNIWSRATVQEVARFKQGMQRFEQRLAEIVHQRMVDGVSEDAGDFLSLMLKSNAQQGRAFSMSDIRDQMFTWLNGGSDTTSSMYAWMVYLIALNPEVEQRIQHEVDQHLAMLDDFSHLTYDMLQPLRYCANVVKETLRLMPPAPFFPRALARDIVLDGHVIPKDVCV
jgi:cytochrome P450